MSEKQPAETPSAFQKLRYHLYEMAKIDPELYDRILDTPGFSFHFNEICNLARTGVIHGTADFLMKLQTDVNLAEAKVKLDTIDKEQE